MNNYFKFAKGAALFAGILTLGVEAAPTWVNLPVAKIFAPTGFDSNDNTQVIVAGSLPNLCYKSPEATAVIEGDVVKVSVRALYEASEGAVCAQVQVPFLEKASLNVLETGTYTVLANVDTAQLLEEKITIKQAASVDVNDHVYARVNHVEVTEGSRTVKLKGDNPSDCYVLDYIKPLSNEKDTFSVLPIMKKVRNFCPLKMVPFEYPFDVPAGLTAEEILLHVRNMQGDSVNVIFQNKIKEQQ